MANDDIRPKLGHYEGTAVDFDRVNFRKISWDVEIGYPSGIEIRNVHLAGVHFHNHPFAHVHGYGHQFHFTDKRTSDNGAAFSGHGRWKTQTSLEGDFREFHRGTPYNTYFTYHMHWVKSLGPYDFLPVRPSPTPNAGPLIGPGSSFFYGDH